MVKNLFYRLMSGVHLNHGLKRMKVLQKKIVSREAQFAIPFAYRGKGVFKSIEPRQNSIEIERLYKTVCDLEPKRVLEIGTARGGTLFLWTRAAADNAILVSVDLPEGEFGGAYPIHKVPFYKTFARPKQTLHLLRKDSHQAATLTEVRKLFQGEQIDFAFIDGDHTYEGVKADFLDYGPLVRPGGIIAFHDILPRPDMPEIQVDRFWEEIKKGYDSRELIGPDNSGRKIGIGVILVGENGVKGDCCQVK